MAIRKRSMLAVALVAGFAVAIPACSSNDDRGGKTAESNTGSVGFNLIVGGLQLNSVTMTITNPTLLSAPIVRTINVASSQATVSAFVGGLPIGGGYTVQLTSSKATDGADCAGEASFSVEAGPTKGVSVALVCQNGTAAPTRGSVNINGTVTVTPECAYLTQVVVSPLTVAVGDSIELFAADSAKGSSGYTWSSPNGTITNGNAPSASYRCDAQGSQQITVSFQGAAGCAADVITATVLCEQPVCGNGVVQAGEQCDPPSAGNCSATCQLIGGSGGASSSGGATSGGATSGGATSGGATSGGATSGGATSGGATSGGATSGGATSGGSSSGGAANACVTCQNEQCPGPVAAVAARCAETNTLGVSLRPLCDAYQACIASTNCASQTEDLDGNPEPRFCYCGSLDSDACFAPTANPQGPCRTAFDALAGATQNLPAGTAPSPAIVGNIFFELANAFGAEGQLMSCTQLPSAVFNGRVCDRDGYCAQ